MSTDIYVGSQWYKGWMIESLPIWINGRITGYKIRYGRRQCSWVLSTVYHDSEFGVRIAKYKIDDIVEAVHSHDRETSLAEANDRRNGR